MRTLIVGAACFSPIIFLALLGTAPFVGLGIMAATHLALVYTTLRPNVQWLGPVITHFRTSRNEVWLTIDDGPAEDTLAVLDLLARYGAKATFFVKGTLASARPHLVRAMIDAGHSVANHSQTHPSGTFWCLPPGAIAREVETCNETLRSITGTAPRWFRAPVGMKNPFVHPVLSRLGMRLIGWSSRGFDGVFRDSARIVERITRAVDAGTIVVLHQGLEHSGTVIEGVLDSLQRSGFAFVVPADDQLTVRDARSDPSGPAG